MLTTNNINKLNVLITRSEKKAQQLALSIQQQGMLCVNQPLFDYQPLDNSQKCEALLTQVDIVIFVSVAAVEFAHTSYPASYWQFKHVLAVGKATQNALKQLDILNVLSPEQENSEGLLKLPLLETGLCDKKITIVRGNGGREHLAETLKNRGSKVSYLESYQRVWRIFPKDISKQWYEQQINCIVVTSNAILEKLVQLMRITTPSNINDITSYWLKQCVWIVVSKRIANTAVSLGLTQVVTCSGASDKQIIAALKSLPSI
jgi:uroporphyrinogen-III synthase